MALTVLALVALAGTTLIAIGAALWHVELGFIVAGVELIAIAYVGTYLARQKGAT